MSNLEEQMKRGDVVVHPSVELKRPTHPAWRQPTPAQMKLIRNQYAQHTTEDEFNLYIETCKHTGLDPIKRQIYCLVYNKDDPAKRRCVYIVSIGGYRKIAQDCHDFLPPSPKYPTEWVIDESLIDRDGNPAGLVECTVTVCKIVQGIGPWPVSATARWEELAPTYRNKEGKIVLPYGSNWRKMPKLMLEKCAEVAAIRRGWPEQTQGDGGPLYAEEELQEQFSAWELADKGVEEERLAKIGLAGNEISMVWDVNSPIVTPEPPGTLADKMMAFVEKNDKATVRKWWDANLMGRQRFWAHNANDALQVKKAVETKLKGQDRDLSGAGEEASSGGAGDESPPDPSQEPSAYAVWFEKALANVSTPGAVDSLLQLEALQIDRLPENLQEHLGRAATRRRAELTGGGNDEKQNERQQEA